MNGPAAGTSLPPRCANTCKQVPSIPGLQLRLQLPTGNPEKNRRVTERPLVKLERESDELRSSARRSPMVGFSLTWRTLILIKANKVKCMDRGIFSLFGPTCGLDVLVVLALLCVAGCCCCVCCVAGWTSNRRYLRRVACMCICACVSGAIYVLHTRPTPHRDLLHMCACT